jgi:hypothetical protein
MAAGAARGGGVRCGGALGEAASAVVMHLTKLIVFGAAAVLTWRTGLYGPVLSPASACGAWTGKAILDRLPIPVFVVLVEAGLIASGVLLLITGG